MANHLIVIEKEAWEELTGLVRDLAIEVRKLVKDRTQSEILTHREAATYLNCSTDHLHDLKNGRKLPFIQVGKKVTYRLGDLDRFMEEHRVGKRS